jgi:hypothetical protein
MPPQTVQTAQIASLNLFRKPINPKQPGDSQGELTDISLLRLLAEPYGLEVAYKLISFLLVWFSPEELYTTVRPPPLYSDN